MRKIILLATVLLFFSCKKDNKNPDYLTFKGKRLEITYNPLLLNNLKDNDIIEIDGIKMIHKSNLYQLEDSTGYYLPSKNNVILKVENKKREEKGNVINISRTLIQNLMRTGKYNFINPSKTSLFGKIIFERIDKKTIKISFRKNYPASVIEE